MRHTWTSAEIAETILIAQAPQAQWPTLIAKLNAKILRSDPTVEVKKVHAAVCAAANCLAGAPDAFPKASAELRRQVAVLKNGEGDDLD